MKSIGIDIGSYSVKVAEVIATANSYKVIGLYRNTTDS